KAENDAFGNDYDEDAWVEGYKVYSAEDLNAAIANGETEIALMADVELEEPIVIPAGTHLAGSEKYPLYIPKDTVL
ncbi:MAG: hypothetical protein IIW81_02875, partial [Oscillospiraceae bacterium]|nr:hypothetical protein [Oscillospiraceae bacterium]